MVLAIRLVIIVLVAVFIIPPGLAKVCDYDLEFDICVQHLSKNESTDCDNLKSEISVELTEKVLDLRTLSLQWRGNPIDNLEFTADNAGGDGVQFTTSNIDPGLQQDLMIGLSHIFLKINKHDSFSNCVVESSRDGLRSVRKCLETSRSDALHHIQQLETEKVSSFDDDNLVALEAYETFSHFSNLDRSLGEMVRTSLNLKRTSCRVHDQINLPETMQLVKPLRKKQKIKTQADPNIDEILKEKDAIKLVSDLKLYLETLTDETDILKILRRYKTSQKFAYILEACGATGSFRVYRAVLKTLPPKSENIQLLERFLIALSLNPRLEAGVLDDLEEFVKKYKNHPEIVETAFYCICKQRGRSKQSVPDLERVLGLVGGLGCTQPLCQRSVLLCIAALKSDEFSDDIVDILETSEDGKMVELGARVLAGPGIVHPNQLPAVQAHVWNLINTKSLKTEQLSKLLDLQDLSSTHASVLQQLLQTKDIEQRAYIAQKIISSRKSAKKNYSILSLAAKGESVHIAESGPVGLGGGGEKGLEGGFSFSTSMSGGALTRTSFNLQIVDVSGQKMDLISIHSFIGGISGMVGEADPDDDKDANASLQISILGLPLRPLVLFSGMGDLLELYWSGAGQEKTTLLQGTVPLEETEKQWETLLGLRVNIKSSLLFHILSQGEGSVSIWDSSGRGSLETSVSLQGLSRVSVEAEGGAHLSSKMHLNTGISAQTKVMMDSTVVGCVVMSSEALEVKVELEGRATNFSQQTVLPGRTWNINHKNNRLCSKLENM